MLQYILQPGSSNRRVILSQQKSAKQRLQCFQTGKNASGIHKTNLFVGVTKCLVCDSVDKKAPGLVTRTLKKNSGGSTPTLEDICTLDYRASTKKQQQFCEAYV